jgi:hypothetical protein
MILNRIRDEREVRNISNSICINILGLLAGEIMKNIINRSETKNTFCKYH